jgi:hypothetical protein
MRLRLSDVLVRAHQRGYAADEIRPCLVKDLGGGWYEVDVDHASYPRNPRPGYRPALGLGDFVANGLAFFGITKDRVQSVASAVGISDCGCAKRQEALNVLGKKIGIG